MAEKITEIKCPACGASLSVETGKKQIVCEYCDTTIFLNNDNEKINRNIDEAEIKKSENEKIIKLKEMEMEGKKQEYAPARSSREGLGPGLESLGVEAATDLGGLVALDDGADVQVVGGHRIAGLGSFDN